MLSHSQPSYPNFDNSLFLNFEKGFQKVIVVEFMVSKGGFRVTWVFPPNLNFYFEIIR